MSPSPRPSLAEIAAAPIDDDDVRVLQQVASIYDALDPVPSGLVDRAQFGITLDALHAEVAQLQRSADLSGVRSATNDVQTITFTSSTLTTMITVTQTSPDQARIDGWVAPGERLTVELRTAAGGRHTTESDEDGRFVFTAVPRGLAQFVLRRSSSEQPPIITPSIEL